MNNFELTIVFTGGNRILQNYCKTIVHVKLPKIINEKHFLYLISNQ